MRTPQGAGADGVKIANLGNTIRHMSGGQRQCVAIARTATFASKLIIMDEPTAALGVQETAQVENIIRNLKANGEPLILISHNMRQVFDLVDRIVVFRRGRIVANLEERRDGRAGRGRLHHRSEDGARICRRRLRHADFQVRLIYEWWFSVLPVLTYSATLRSGSRNPPFSTRPAAF